MDLEFLPSTLFEHSREQRALPILEFSEVTLSVPTMTVSPSESSINPIKLISDFYGRGNGRAQKVLLSNLTFSVMRGMRIGVLGENGAGKTTLLRLIAGVYKPTSGDMVIRGTARGLFNIQLGMNNNATGVENIYLRGLQMNMTLLEIRKRMNEIIQFSELGDSIHEIFGNYSTGMRLRLSFAISTILKPDILVMDEWIGSGDQTFKEKVANRMDDLVNDSKCLVLATHNRQLMERLCTHAIILNKGGIKFFGKVEEALPIFYKK